MNLIEKLGGYEKAKDIRDINIQEFDGDASGVTIHYMGDTFIQEDLVSAILEYRRENNIFECGDKIVHIYDCENSMLFTVKDINEKGYSFGNDWGWRGVISNMGVGHTFRLATPEEIKAGHRL